MEGALRYFLGNRKISTFFEDSSEWVVAFQTQVCLNLGLLTPDNPGTSARFIAMTWPIEVRTLVGNRLRNLRKQKGVSCAYVAEAVLGYPRHTHVAVSRLERGILPSPDRETLEALTSFYGVRLSEVLPPTVLSDLREPSSTLEARKELQHRMLLQRCAAHIKHLRTYLKLSPAELALALDKKGLKVQPEQIADWESAKEVPGDAEAEALAGLVYSTKDWLFYGPEP